MDTTDAFASFALFGIRLDSATLAQATMAAWEGALARAGMRVMLADMWTLLLGQREFGVWEALSAADYVYPVADDVVLRRAAQHQGMMVMKPDLLLYDLLDAAARANRPVSLVAPLAELDSDVSLVRRIWPQLQVEGVSRGDAEMYDPDSKLISVINRQAPALLVMGGYSPWQEEFVHSYRDDLEYGAALTMPTLHTAMAAIGQRVGMPVTGIGRMRRKAAISRAITTTLRPAAEASAETVGTWLAGAREGISDLSAALHTRHSPAALRRLAALAGPPRRSIAVRVSQARELEESSSRWAATSPLARISPPRLPALPAPSTSAPSGSAASWPAPESTAAASAAPTDAAPGASGAALPVVDARESISDDEALEWTGHPRSPFAPPDEDHSWPRIQLGPADGSFQQPAAPASHPYDVPTDEAGEELDDEYDTFVVEGGVLSSVEPATGESLAELAPADEADETDETDKAAPDATRLLPDRSAATRPAPRPAAPDQVGPTTRLRPPAPEVEDDPEALRVLATIDDLPPTRLLDGRVPDGLRTPRTSDAPRGDGGKPARSARPTRPLRESEAGARETKPGQPRPDARLSRKYVVRRMPRNIGHRRGRPRQ